MTFVHTFWSKPFLNNRFNKYQELLPVILTDYAYSVECVIKHGYSIKLITDSFGKDFLGFLPYDKIIALDSLENESINFAAQIKFEALKRMSLDDVLIDGDLFIQKRTTFEIIDSINYDVLYSFYEPTEFAVCNEEKITYYNRMFSVFNNKKDGFMPEYINCWETCNCMWPNTSLLKFSNQQLKQEYIQQYEYHKKLLSDSDFGRSWPDIWIEQKHLEILTKDKYTSRPIVYGFPSKEADSYSCLIGFTHLGEWKAKYNEMILRALKNLNPVLYNKVLQQIETYKNKKPL